jgi:hypothetical protein
MQSPELFSYCRAGTLTSLTASGHTYANWLRTDWQESPEQNKQDPHARGDEPGLKEGNTSVGDAPADSQEESKHVDMTPIGALHYMLVHFLDILLKLWSRIGTFVFTECLLIFKLHINYANQRRLITN